MPGKVIFFNPNRFRIGSTSIDLNAYRTITAGSINSESLDRTTNLLRYRKGESSLSQDIKVLVLCRLICETHSQGKLALAELFEKMRNAFPQPPKLDDYLLPVPHQTGVGREVIDKCRPQKGDPTLILRAKKQALLLNLTELITGTLVKVAGVVNPQFDKTDFKAAFSWTWEILGDFPAADPRDAALQELIQAHVFDPPLPFNIQLPEKK